MTHSLIAIFKGEFGRANHENLLGIPLFFASILLAVFMVLTNKTPGWGRKKTWASFSALLIYAIARNLR